MQTELWVYSPELDRSFCINNAQATITPVTLTAKEREQMFLQHEIEQAVLTAEKERYEGEQWEAIRREYYDECYRDEPDTFYERHSDEIN